MRGSRMAVGSYLHLPSRKTAIYIRWFESSCGPMGRLGKEKATAMPPA
jgi:hypothetical protein